MEKTKEKLQSSINKDLKGYVEITLKNSETNEIRKIQKNLIVNNAYTRIAELLGYTTGGLSIISINPGIGSVAATVDDTDITNLTALPVSLPVTASCPSANYVKFHAEWALGEISTENVTDLGLFFGDSSF